VDYHHALGFDKFLIYDNSKNFEMKQWGKLKGDHVEVIHFPGDTKQMPAYFDCGKKLAETGEYEWAAFFDADEYLVLKKHEHVADMLEEHCSWGALVINWLVFESNGWNLQALEPVTRRFQYHLAWDNPVQNHVKSIVRLADVKELAGENPHNFANVKEGSTVHDSNGKPVKGPFNTDKPRDVVVIHHYHTKSRKEYVAKRNRGRSDAVEDKEAARETLKLTEEDLASSLAGEDLPMDTKHFEEQGLVFDDSAWQFLKSHVSAYGLFDEIGLIKTNESRRKI